MRRFTLSRRQALAGAGVLGAAASIPFACAGGSPSRTRRIIGSGATPAVLQIVAHQDDDFLFMNPDMAVTLDAGIPVTTVYLTAGEAGGAVDGSQTRSQFAADRQAGVRAAYAQMMRAPDDWTREAVALAGGPFAEVATLRAASQIRLFFLNLPDGYDEDVPSVAGAPDGLAVSGLLLNLRPTIPTIVPDDGPVTTAYHYSREALLATLTGLLREHRPTIVRTLDPMFAEQHWRGSSNIGGDNPDHIATARFADIAVRRHLADTPEARISSVHYVGYGTAALGPNLSARQAERKAQTFWTYADHDRNVRHFHDSYLGYPLRRRHRWSPNSLALTAGPDGVRAFAVLNNQVAQWSCADPTADWEGPVPVGGNHVVAVDATRQLDGRLRLFALSVDAEQGVSQITTCVQRSPGGTFGSWVDLGQPLASPDPAGDQGSLRGDALGTPSAVATPDGRVHLFVRAWDATLFRRVLTGDRWTDWTLLPGQDYGTGGRRGNGLIHRDGRYPMDGQFAIVDAAGAVEVYGQAMVEPATDPTAPAVPRLIRWCSDDRGELTVDPAFPAVQSASDPVAVLDSAARIQVFYQLPDTSETGILAHETEQGWSAIRRLPATGGSGTPVAVTTPAQGGGLIHVAVSTTGFGLGIIAQRPGGDYTSWRDLGGFSQARPALTVDHGGRFVAALLGPDGRLRVAAQQRPGTDEPYSALRVVGS